MSCRIGFVWETPQHFMRYIGECGIVCELVTPHMLAAPFFRGSFNGLVIPTGFGNPAYSRLLPALRASSGRIRRYVENGGYVLVFGAAIDRPDAYDWLPFPVTYTHDFRTRAVDCSGSDVAARLLEDFNADAVECDGIFPQHGADPAGRCGSDAVILEKTEGKGTFIVTSVHEFPSRAFLKSICTSGIQTLF